MCALSLQERTYGTNIPCLVQGPSDTVPVSGTPLCNCIVELLHLMVEREDELGSVRKGTLLLEAMHCIDCGFVPFWNNISSCIARRTFSLKDGESLCNCTFHVQTK